MSARHTFAADLHIHSRYAYACSKNLTLENLASTAKTKGIDLLATGDFTHPAWLRELQDGLTEADEGTFEYAGVRFVLGTEVSCVYRQGGRSRRLHLLLYMSSFEAVGRFSYELAQRGAKLEGDGRPTVGLSAQDLLELALDVDPMAVVAPAHIWTPWYGMLGSVSGFDSLEDCFGPMAPLVHAVETGLSSDPAMNWGVPGIRDRTIVSFSDAHSLPNLGRELTVFEGKPTYRDLRRAIEENGVSHTVEFFPEEGKYHFNGHRNCGVRQSPTETEAQQDSRCPACGRPMTLGVLHRVRSLSPPADNEEGSATQQSGVEASVSSGHKRAPYLRLVPLEELLAETLQVGRRSKKVRTVYTQLCAELGSEIEVLARSGADDIRALAGERVAQAILKARAGEVNVEPGFDGQYGTVKVWNT